MRYLVAFLFVSSFVLFAQEIDTGERGEIVETNGSVVSNTPVVGYITKESQGRKGLQAYYHDPLSGGKDLPTAISTTLQKMTEEILDKMKVELNATETLAMVMKSKTGAIITIASSNRYDPTHIMQEDIPNLNPKFTEYLFEPGSVMKPISLAVAMDKGVVSPHTLIDGHDGVLKIDERYTIKDDKVFDQLTATDVIVHSSNIGISEVAWKLTGKEFRDGLLRFGFGSQSGIDLPGDLNGTIKDEIRLAHKLHRANTAYGYGMFATPIQLLKAYSAFANEGLMVTPKIAVDHPQKSQRVISKKTANEMKQILIENVQRGTGSNAKFDGLIIGGKTGTAHIAKNGKYTDSYNSSFFGFTEDDYGHSYTIGVLVIDPKVKGKHFASRSTVPIFKDIVDKMVEKKLLIPRDTRIDTDTDKKVFITYTDQSVVDPLIGAKLVKTFGEYTDPIYGVKVFNESVTLQSSDRYKKVYNVMDGKVVFSGDSAILGQTVIMAHHDRLHTIYAGLEEIDSTVQVGETLERASVLGIVDEKLVFQVTQKGKAVDPMNLIMYGKEEKRNYVKACDVNGDGKLYYTLEERKEDRGMQATAKKRWTVSKIGL